MKKTIYTLFLLFQVFTSGIGQNQAVQSHYILYDNISSKKQGDSVYISLVLDLTSLQLKKQQMLLVKPMIQSADQSTFYSSFGKILAGKKRYKAVCRDLEFGSYVFDESIDPEFPLVGYGKNKPDTLQFNFSVPYEPWLRDAQLIINEKIIACNYRLRQEENIQLLNRILLPLFTPTYRLTFIIPPVEPVKQRSETYSARLNFKVGQHELLTDYKTNAQQLSEARKIISVVKNDPDLTLTELKVTGYASPEGNYYSNMKLSENRARAFSNYLKGHFGIKENQITVDWFGEDWEGLARSLKSAGIPDKDYIIWLIENEPDNTSLKTRIKNLNGGSTYRKLLNDYYPPLRRNEYTISYIARAFDIEEAKLLIKTKPQYLSLNEMFLVANSYPVSSPESKEIFEIAFTIYPDSPVAIVNSATSDIQNGDIDKAIEKLKTIDLPEAWNNLGVAYIKKKEYETAEACFSQAAKAGDENGIHNSEQLKEWIRNN